MLNLQKNDILDLTKKNPGLNNVMLGAGWDVAKKKGFFGFGGGKDFDLDLVAFLLDGRGKMIKDSTTSLIYFGCQNGKGIKLHGDNLTGAGDGDDEKISVTLNDIPMECEKIVFAICGKERNQTFAEVKNAYVRLLDADKGYSEICRYNLSEDGSRARSLIFSELIRDNGDWKYKAVGELIDGSIRDLRDRFR